MPEFGASGPGFAIHDPEVDAMYQSYTRELGRAYFVVTDGTNVLGGGGIALYYYFTPKINIVTGPVWFNTNKYNGSWKWSIQVDFNFSLFDANWLTCQ